MKVNIAIADDHKIFRKSLLRLLGDYTGFSVLIEASNGSELIEKLSKNENQIDVLLLDLQMPEMDGFQCLHILEKEYPDIKTIILSQLSGEHYLKKAISLGVFGYFTKDSEPDELLGAIREVKQGGFYFEGKLKHFLDEIAVDKKNSSKNPFVHINFSKRELEIIYWSVMELKTKEIAKKLNISDRTVEGHKTNLIKKTGTKSFLGVILIALDFNLSTYHSLFSDFNK